MAANIPILLRFLTSNKIPLQTALPAIKSLNEAQLNSLDAIASTDIQTLQKIFSDEKTAKQILSAAKRSTKPSSKKRSAEEPTTPTKRRRKISPIDPANPSWEMGLDLPLFNMNTASLTDRTIVTNRAPLLMAFAIVGLKHTLPHLPASSRFSLAQGLLDLTAGTKAKSLGITQSSRATELEPGYKKLIVLNCPIPVLRRHDVDDGGREGQKVSFWGLSMQLLEKPPEATKNNPAGLPICLPQAAHGYLTRSFKGQDLADILGAIELLYASWTGVLNANDLDKRGWTWYCRVRPQVDDGKKGWGGKGEVKIKEILELRRKM